ncbi:hypothetical protein BDL97_09G001400 [Sphagnum fallax]|nr:hypothetical protein BDL97_09G001400 [Sphagnum fallax]KAH8950989.1 hypothetical protein BDL97_09G001400 [Sphagnum fallax]
MKEAKDLLAHCRILPTIPWLSFSKDRELDPGGSPPLLNGRPTAKSPSKSRICAKFLLLGAVVLVLSIPLLNILIPARAGGDTDQYWQQAFIGSLNNASLRNHLFHLTKEPHMAGTPEDFATAEYVFQRFQEYGLSAHYTDYDVLLSYPLHRSLILSVPTKEPLTLSLEEKPVEGDPYSSNPKVTPTFHGYAPSGNVSAEVVYANYGRVEDFQKLVELGINVKDAIVIAKYGSIYRGDIVENAAQAGAVAVIIYSDPQDYAANYTEGVYPDSKWLPPSGTQRGSIYRGVGDPLTPNWPSTPDAERISVSDPEAMLPTIPSLPISAEDALPILASLSGPVSPADWHGALDLPQYRVGRGPGVLNLSFCANQTVTQIRNVIAIIKGAEEPDRYIILGNHRDAWVFGAVDPHSGTASLLEVAQRLGELVWKGWRPRRSIVLCSWDAEEYGLVGSTEWVEQNIDLLGLNAVAYLNLDTGVGGSGFSAGASPQLDGLLQEVTKQVKDPDSVDGTVFEEWVASGKGSAPLINRLGGGDSDFAAFLQHAGVPALDLHFGDDQNPMYHSAYDNFHWMETFGDPLFHRHVAVTSLFGLLAMRLSSDAVLPFDYVKYATVLQSYATGVQMELSGCKALGVSANPLLSAISRLEEAAVQIKQQAKDAEAQQPQGSFLPSALLGRRFINDRLLQAERAFLDDEGLTGIGQSWYKHLVYGPVSNNNYGTAPFPGIQNALALAQAERNEHDDEDAKKQQWAAVQHEIWRVARVVDRAAIVLHGSLT